MSNGLHAAAAGLAAQQARMDALADDIANASTPGYKKRRVEFHDLVYGGEQGVRVGAGAAARDAGRSFVQGALVESANPLAVAIEGSGFLQVRRTDGQIALTRAGDLRLDAQRNLVLASGEHLVPPLQLPDNINLAELSIAADGTVSVAGRELGRISVVDVPAPAHLAAAGDGLFLPTAASGATAPARDAAVRQGFVEASNVDVADSMVSLIQAQRAFELASRALKLQDTLLEIANGIRR